MRKLSASASAIAFVVAATIVNGQPALHAVVVFLPVHYWQDWTRLFNPHAVTHLGAGILCQIATTALATIIAALVLRRRTGSVTRVPGRWPRRRVRACRAWAAMAVTSWFRLVES